MISHKGDGKITKKYVQSQNHRQNFRFNCIFLHFRFRWTTCLATPQNYDPTHRVKESSRWSTISTVLRCPRRPTGWYRSGNSSSHRSQNSRRRRRRSAGISGYQAVLNGRMLSVSATAKLHNGKFSELLLFSWTRDLCLVNGQRLKNIHKSVFFKIF